ncbi:hypothetical protein H3C65_00685 [Patescibacteria group bacterium]|nr:hypothetical protein [Patescibacteria group bacterium]
MDTTQFLLTVVLTATTVLMVVVGIQLISVLKELRRTIKKIGIFVDEFDKRGEKNNPPEQQKLASHKKKAALHSILDKINILSPTLSSKTKKFFIKEKK